MSLTIEKENKRYTYKDLLSQPEEERREIIEGIPYNMTPGPERLHQEVSGMLFSRFHNYLRGKSCKVYSAPFDVRFPERDEKDEDIENVVQPDMVVVCDKSKLDRRGCKGSPDLIAEILSRSTAKRDMMDKLLLYQKMKVKEYWIVHPIDRTVMVFKLKENGSYGIYDMYSEEDTIKVGIFEDLEINLKEIFSEYEDYEEDNQ